jgi:hypothetical protein
VSLFKYKVNNSKVIYLYQVRINLGFLLNANNVAETGQLKYFIISLKVKNGIHQIFELMYGKNFTPTIPRSR